MVLALLAVLTAPIAPTVVQATPSGDPPIHVSLNSGGNYERGDRAKVRLRVAEDGYVIVLRADADGRVRVLFPLDPGDDNFVRGGRDYELPGRGGRETFFVDDRQGAGTVLAARSDDAFQFDRFTRGDHWDYRVLASDRMQDDPESGLLDLVTAMADSAHFDYDVLGYSVDGADRYRYSRYGYGSSFHIGIGFGSRYRCGYNDPFYDPYACDSYYYDPFYYDGFYDGFYYRPFRYSCYSDPFCFGFRRNYGYAPGRGGSGFVFKRPAAPPPLVLPRDRFPRTPVGFGGRDPLVTTGRDLDRRPDVTPRRREKPSEASRPRETGGSWSGGERPSTRETPRASTPRASNPRPSTPRPSTPSRSSGSKPSNSGTRRH
jgi:hypothetical protein